MRLVIRWLGVIGVLVCGSVSFLFADNAISDGTNTHTISPSSNTSPPDSCGSCGVDPVLETVKKACVGTSPITVPGSSFQYGGSVGDRCMWYEKDTDDGPITMSCDYIGIGDTPVGVEDFCCGVVLNTNVPFVGKCIANGNVQFGDQTDSIGAFARLMKAMANIVMSLILVSSMIMLVVSGVMWAGGNPGEGKAMMKRVIISLVLLGSSGIILRLINPVFFQ